jgi:hypothetical protein
MTTSGWVWVLALAGSVSTTVFAADREIKVDDRLDASAETLGSVLKVREAKKDGNAILIDRPWCTGPC